MLWSELQRGVLAWRKSHGFSRLDAQAAYIVRQLLYGYDSAFDDLGWVNDHLIHIGNFNRATLRHYRLASQYITVLTRCWPTRLRTAVAQFTCGDFAPASAAPTGHATVGNRHDVVAQHIKQILSAVYVQPQVVWLHHKFHGISI